MQASVSRDGLTDGPSDVTFGGRLDPANVLDCSAYQQWQQGKVGKLVLKEAAQEMERLLTNIVKATGRESDIEMHGENYTARKAVVDAEREFFLSDEWCLSPGPSGRGTGSPPSTHPDKKVAAAAAASSSAGDRRAAAAHPRLDDNGRPVRNMHADRSSRRLDLNNMDEVGWEVIAEQVPLCGEKTARAIIAYREQRAAAAIREGQASGSHHPEGEGEGEERGAGSSLEVVEACRPIKSYVELLECNGGPVRGGVGKGIFESLMCFTTL